jgi:hypothetical protein
MNGTNLSGAALIERGQANVAWVKAHMPLIIASAVGNEPESFGKKIARAIKARTTGRATTRNQRQQPVATDESFAGKLKCAVAKRRVERR